MPIAIIDRMETVVLKAQMEELTEIQTLQAHQEVIKEVRNTEIRVRQEVSKGDLQLLDLLQRQEATHEIVEVRLVLQKGHRQDQRVVLVAIEALLRTEEVELEAIKDYMRVLKIRKSGLFQTTFFSAILG
jgi:hypothetical protein